ncbi:bacteriocin-like protein [Limosilactobacillus caviae]
MFKKSYKVLSNSELIKIMGGKSSRRVRSGWGWFLTRSGRKR